MSSLKRLLSLCQRNGILSIEQSTKGPSLHYGPLGSLLKRNIFNEWLSSLMSSKEFPVFPIEVQNPREECFLHSPAEGGTLPAVLDTSMDYGEFFRPQPPFGLAIYGPCVNSNKSEEWSFTDFSFLKGLRAWTRLTLVFRCPPSQPMHWFYFWSKQRHIWWRKLSSIPSQFSLSGITCVGSSQGLLHVQLDSPGGGPPLPLEAVSLWEAGERGHFVTCQVELEAAVMAYLANSRSDKWRDGEGKEVLQLHSRLSPYQASVWAEGREEKLHTAAAHLAQQLKAKGVSVCPHSPDVPFARFDEMGIPYTVVLAKSSLANGIAGLRSRDTTLQEEVHIAELTKKLTQYLKI